MIKFQAKLCLTILKVLVTYKETSMLPRALAKYVNNFKVLITYNNLKKKKKVCEKGRTYSLMESQLINVSHLAQL